MEETQLEFRNQKSIAVKFASMLNNIGEINIYIFHQMAIRLTLLLSEKIKIDYFFKRLTLSFVLTFSYIDRTMLFLSLINLHFTLADFPFYLYHYFDYKCPGIHTFSHECIYNVRAS